MTRLNEAHHDPGPPPWFGYKQVDEAPYPMTHEEFITWPREPGYKHELHAGMFVRLWVGPFAFYGGFAILRAYQPAEQRYLITVPELPGCETELRLLGSIFDQNTMEVFEQSMQKGAEAIDRWVQAAQAAGAPIPLPRALEQPPEEPPLVHLKRYGVIPLEIQADFDLAVGVLHALVDRVDGDETHPLMGLLNALANETEAYKASSEKLKALLAPRIAEAERGELYEGTMEDLLTEIHEQERGWQERLHDPKALPALEAPIERALAADDAGQGLDQEELTGPETLAQFPVSGAERAQGKRGQEWREVLRQVWEEGIQSGPGRFANADELIAEAKRRYLAAGEQHLEELLVEGLNSGPGILVDDAYWDKLQRELEAEYPSEDHEAHNGN